MTISGLKLDFSNGGATVKESGGEKLLPHRNAYIKRKLKERDFKGLDKIFFEAPAPHCNNESTQDQLVEEGKLLTEYIKLVEKDIYERITTSGR